MFMRVNRTQIYLNPAQQSMLRSIADKQKTSLSEIVRQAINAWLKLYKPADKKHPLSSLVGLYHDAEDTHGSENHDDLYE